MASSNLEQYRISDFIEWESKKTLVLNPHFQRGAVWKPSAKTFLIDTILRQLPMPKIYMRTKIDIASKRSYREVVDGQQRLRAILDFASDKFALGPRASAFGGMRYSDLPEEAKETFLTYAIAVDQLINASDADVLEIFARLNSYSVPLNPAELRHAIYQGPFKWTVYEAATKWDLLWDEFEVLTVRERVRMLHISLMAEMYGVILQGVTDGGQPKINRLYEKYDAEFIEAFDTTQKVDVTLQFIIGNFGEVVAGSALGNAPHFLMLFAAVAHSLFGIPAGDMGDAMPVHSQDALTDLTQAKENLATLSQVISEGDGLGRLADFARASSSSTHRIAQRRVRFPVFVKALRATPI